MKITLNEELLNAYINEALKQEINENGWTKLANFANKKAAKAAAKGTRKLGQLAGGDATRMARAKTPLNFVKNTQRARNSRLALKDFRKGKAVEGKVGNTSYFAKQENGITKFYSDAACKNEITDPKLLKSVRSSWNSIVSHAKNVLNSARRNMFGTAAVAGLGTGWAIDHNSHKNDPWNATEDDNTEQDANNETTGGFDGAFPWDNTTPEWTPRPPQRPQQTISATNAPATPTQSQPQQPRREMEALPAGQQINMPTGVTGPTQTIARNQQQATFPQNVVNVMNKTAALHPGVASQREKNIALRNMKNNAINTINSNGYGAPGNKDDIRTVKDAYKNIKRGDQHPSL